MPSVGIATTQTANPFHPEMQIQVPFYPESKHRFRFERQRLLIQVAQAAAQEAPALANDPVYTEQEVETVRMIAGAIVKRSEALLAAAKDIRKIKTEYL